jgi:hypothetical protein
MLQKLKTLHTILGSAGFILTGSAALAYHGLITFEEVKDLDILLVTPDQSAIDVLDRLQLANPSLKYRVGGPVTYSFIYEGVKVDIWVINSQEDKISCLTQDGIRLASIKSIVNAKINIGRSKDWIHLMQLGRRIFNPVTFNSVLPLISNHSEGYEEILDTVEDKSSLPKPTARKA